MNIIKSLSLARPLAAIGGGRWPGPNAPSARAYGQTSLAQVVDMNPDYSNRPATGTNGRRLPTRNPLSNRQAEAAVQDQRQDRPRRPRRCQDTPTVSVPLISTGSTELMWWQLLNTEAT